MSEPMVEPLSRVLGQIETRVDRHDVEIAAIQSSLTEYDRHLSEQDRKSDRLEGKVDRLEVTLDKALSAVHEKVGDLDTKVGGGFSRVGASQDRLERKLDPLLAAEASRVRRRAGWREASHHVANSLQYVFGVLDCTVLGFAITHPSGDLPDPPMIPWIVALSILLVLAVSYNAVLRGRAGHERDAGQPDQPEEPEGPDHKERDAAQGG